MKGPKKWNYLNEFKRGTDGSYVYTGDYYSLSDSLDYKKTNVIILLSVFFLAALVALSGSFNAAGLKNTFYVIIPFVGEVICAFVLVWSSVRLAWAGERIRAYVIQTACPKIGSGSLALGVFGFISLAASVVFVFLNGFENSVFRCVFFWVMKAVIITASFLFRRYYKKLEWVKV